MINKGSTLLVLICGFVCYRFRVYFFACYIPTLATQAQAETTE